MTWSDIEEEQNGKIEFLRVMLPTVRRAFGSKNITEPHQKVELTHGHFMMPFSTAGQLMVYLEGF